MIERAIQAPMASPNRILPVVQRLLHAREVEARNVTTLLVAQLSGTSSFRVAWRWSGVFYILAAVWLAAAVSLLG